MTSEVNGTKYLGWTFWLWWILASIGGAVAFLIVVFPLNLLFARIAPTPSATDPLQSLVFSASNSGVLGVLCGFTQWLVLRRVKPAMRTWVLATVLGYILVPELMTIIRIGALPQLNNAIVFLKFGAVLGVAQWIVLRGRVNDAGWWIAISVMGWVFTFLVISAAHLSGLYAAPFDMLAAFLVPTIVTGGGMLWLLQQKAPTEPRHWGRRIAAGVAIIGIFAIIGMRLGVNYAEEYIQQVDPWRSWGKPPLPATKILFADVSEVYVQTASGQSYRCCWQPAQVPPTPSTNRDCYLPPSTPPPLPVTPPPLPAPVVDRLEIAKLIEGCEHVTYVVLDDGSVWRWQYSMYILKDVMPVFDGVFGCIGGAIIGLIAVMMFFAIRSIVRIVAH